MNGFSGDIAKAFGRTISGALDSNGEFFPLDSLAQTAYKDASGNVTSIVATNGVNTWTQTYTYGASQNTISQWMKA